MRVLPATRDPGGGFWKVACSTTGSRRVRFFGFMENVRCASLSHSRTPFDGFLYFVAGSGKTVLWFVDH